MNYIILPNSLVLNHDGDTTTIIKGDGRFDKILEKIKEGKLDEIAPLLNVAKVLERNGFEVQHGLVHVNGEALPESLSQRVLDFFNEGLPYTPLLKFWEKLKTNPSFNSRQMLFKFLEHNGHPITTEGNFIAYRSVRSDFKDAHTGTMDNSVGNIVEMDRNLVDDNPNNTCSSGLHVATMSYASTFAQVVLDVEVSPADVVAVPTDYNGTKMRVCRFKVVAVSKGIIPSSLVKSSYDELEDWGNDAIGNEILDGDEVECTSCGDLQSPFNRYCSVCGWSL